MESEGHEEKYRAVIDGGHPEDEPVGQRWGTVEPALRRRRRSYPPTTPRCLRMARYRRTTRDLRRTGRVSGWHRSKRTYKHKRKGELPRDLQLAIVLGWSNAVMHIFVVGHRYHCKRFCSGFVTRFSVAVCSRRRGYPRIASRAEARHHTVCTPIRIADKVLPKLHL